MQGARYNYHEFTPNKRITDTISFISPLQYHQILILRIKLINIEMKQDRISISQLSKPDNFFFNLQVLSFLFNFQYQTQSPKYIFVTRKYTLRIITPFLLFCCVCLEMAKIKTVRIDHGMCPTDKSFNRRFLC